MTNDVRVWSISVGGGYGAFEYVGTEAEAEEMRAHKARWEGAVARKTIARAPDPAERAYYGEHGPESTTFMPVFSCRGCGQKFCGYELEDLLCTRCKGKLRQ